MDNAIDLPLKVHGVRTGNVILKNKNTDNSQDISHLHNSLF